MKTLPIQSLNPGAYVNQPVYLDENYILLTPDVPITTDLIQQLLNWSFREVFTDEEAEIQKPLEKLAETESNGLVTEDDTKEKLIRQEVQKHYESHLEFCHSMFDSYGKKQTLILDSIVDQMKTLLSQIKSHKKYFLRFLDLDRSGFPYMVCHSVNTAILSMAIADTMKIPTHKILEIGMGGLLHELGMFLLPENFQNAARTLNPAEKRALLAHPILGFKQLREKSFPINTCMAVLEHHEKEDGTGYPQSFKGDKISMAGKIVSVASAYDAQITSRPYREAKNAHLSLLEFLREIGKSYDDSVVKKLVYTLSLFPIGSFVELKSGAIAQVVDANPEAPKLPDLKILTNEKKKPITEYPLVKLTDHPEMSIVRVLDGAEVLRLKTDKVIPA